MDPIRNTLERKLSALSEHQSKKILQSYGIPTTTESLVQSADEAVAAADSIGYPVALKPCSPELMHKSERGCIELHLKNGQDVREAYRRVTVSVTEELEGVLVQEMVSGQRELVMGLNRDPQFGPCVMLGLGGIFTELLEDTVFRVAPFGRVEALDMTRELRSRAMLDKFRGQEPADIETICRSLVALGAIGLEHPEISEIDVNPLIIDPHGRIVAVDALVVLEKGSE